ILMFFRSTKNQKSELSIYDPVGVDKEGNEICLLDILSSEETTAQEKMELAEEREQIKANLHVLNENESFVLCHRYGLHGETRITQKEIARKLGISRSYVSRIEKKAIEKLIKAISK
ncbi:MAG: sigma-70 family RNA polymerase sigma factor, partial [Firmicutes bacterium]|nr:sigma-70 family RNA polymerase sigma factor [Bacillota bacterium]